MPYQIIEFEETPNPNAVKCWLDRPISPVPRSFLSASMAQDDPIARAIFARVPVTTLLFNGQWMSVNKRPEAEWEAVKRGVERVLAEVP